MAGDAFRFQILIPGDQLSQLNRVLTRGADGIQNWRPAFEVISTQVEDATVAQFRTQGARGGRPWAPLSAQYAARKALRWPGRPPLIASGAGYGALVNRYDSGHVRDIRPLEMRVGADDRAVPYMKFHQSGTRANFQRDDPVSAGETFLPTGSIEGYSSHRGAGMPRRRPMLLTEADRRGIMRELQRHAQASLSARDVIGGRYSEAASGRDEP